ncbi:hypothetical protein ABW21_db0202269 [Orbilia brochopaga]|nr:hypothetical protein ABW21_db0202269 [Drechslerella brochopaga]
MKTQIADTRILDVSTRNAEQTTVCNSNLESNSGFETTEIRNPGGMIGRGVRQDGVLGRSTPQDKSRSWPASTARNVQTARWKLELRGVNLSICLQLQHFVH